MSDRTAENVFISYGREDIDSALKLYRALTDAGHNPWIDEKNLVPGQQWKAAVRTAIENARYFLLLLSSHSVRRSGYVHKELSEALDILDTYPESDIYLIPVRLDDCQPSQARLKEIQWVDMFPNWDSGLARVLTAIGKRSAHKSDRRDDPPDGSSRLRALSTDAQFKKLFQIMDFRDSPPLGKADSESPRHNMWPGIFDAVHFERVVPTKPHASDPNKWNWATVKSRGEFESLDGFWSSRWRTHRSQSGSRLNILQWPSRPAFGPTLWTDWHKGTALLKTRQDWVFVEYEDGTSLYIILARFVRAGRLVGRYMNCRSEFDDGGDSRPWTGLIVSNRRIDGFWEGFGRWDFRR